MISYDYAMGSQLLSFLIFRAAVGLSNRLDPKTGREINVSCTDEERRKP
jgi:hypothetical protein